MRRGNGSSGEYTDTAGVDGEEPGEVKVLAVGVIAGAAMVVVLAEEVGIGGGGGGVFWRSQRRKSTQRRGFAWTWVLSFRKKCLFIRMECVVCVALLQESMYSEVGLIGDATRPPWLDEPTTGQTEECWLCRPMYCFLPLSFTVSSACLLDVFSLAGGFLCSPFSVDVSQPVKAVDPCRQVEMQIVMYARTGKERKSAT